MSKRAVVGAQRVLWISYLKRPFPQNGLCPIVSLPGFSILLHCPLQQTEWNLIHI